MKENILIFMKKFSYLDFEEENSEDLHLSFTTRENGDVGDEVHGDKDYFHALSVGKKLLKEFNNISVEVDTIDEWVTIDICLNKISQEALNG